MERANGYETRRERPFSLESGESSGYDEGLMFQAKPMPDRHGQRDHSQRPTEHNGKTVTPFRLAARLAKRDDLVKKGA